MMMLGSGNCMSFKMPWYMAGKPACLSMSSEAWRLSHSVVVELRKVQSAFLQLILWTLQSSALSSRHVFS